MKKAQVLNILLTPWLIIMPLVFVFVGMFTWAFSSSGEKISGRTIQLKKDEYATTPGFLVEAGKVYIVEVSNKHLYKEWVEFGLFITDTQGNLLNKTNDVFEFWNEQGTDKEGKWSEGKHKDYVFFRATNTEKIKVGLYWIAANSFNTSSLIRVKLKHAGSLLVGRYGKYLAIISGSIFLMVMFTTIIFDEDR